MTVQSGQSVTVLFTTRVFATGVGTNADSLPTGTLYLNGSSNAATVTVTNISAGLYSAQVTLPTLAVKDEVQLAIAATVSSISDKAVIWTDTKDVLLDSSGQVTYNNTAAATTAAIATAVWQDTTAGDFTAAGSIGKSLFTSGNAPGAASGIALVGSNMGSAASVTARVTANTDQWAGGTIPAPTVTGVPLIDLKYILGTVLTETAGQIAAAFKKFFNIATPASTMDALTLVATATNLTNAPTAGDFTAVMKTSIGTAVAASAVASVTGNVSGGVAGNIGGNVLGNVAGSVGSVAAAVGITSNRKKAATATFEFLMTDATTNAPKTGLTVAMTITKDGGSSAATTNAVTEIGLGQYQIVLTATEMTANNIFLQATATGANTASISIQTQP